MPPARGECRSRRADTPPPSRRPLPTRLRRLRQASRSSARLLRLQDFPGDKGPVVRRLPLPGACRAAPGAARMRAPRRTQPPTAHPGARRSAGRVPTRSAARRTRRDPPPRSHAPSRGSSPSSRTVPMINAGRQSNASSPIGAPPHRRRRHLPPSPRAIPTRARGGDEYRDVDGTRRTEIRPHASILIGFPSHVDREALQQAAAARSHSRST